MTENYQPSSFFPRRLQKGKTSQKSSSFLEHIKAIIYRCLTITDVTAGSCKSFEDAWLQRWSLGCGSFNQELPGLKWICSGSWLWHLLAVGPVGLSSSSVICDFLPAPHPHVVALSCFRPFGHLLGVLLQHILYFLI